MKTVQLLILLALGVISFLSGCASTADTAESAPGQSTSTLPWNSQQSWEGTGQLGSAMGR